MFGFTNLLEKVFGGTKLFY